MERGGSAMGVNGSEWEWMGVDGSGWECCSIQSSTVPPPCRSPSHLNSRSMSDPMRSTAPCLYQKASGYRQLILQKGKLKSRIRFWEVLSQLLPASSRLDKNGEGTVSFNPKNGRRCDAFRGDERGLAGLCESCTSGRGCGTPLVLGGDPTSPRGSAPCLQTTPRIGSSSLA